MPHEFLFPKPIPFRYKIGIEATSVCSQNRSGIANYTVNLIEALSNNELFGSKYNLDLLYKLSRIKKKQYCFKPQTYKPVWHYKSLLPFNKNYQLLHSTDNIFLNYSNAKKIVTIHDLAIFKSQNNIEGYTNEEFKNKTKEFLKTVTSKADAIVTVSQSTKNDLLELFNYPQEKVFVTHLGMRLPQKHAATGILKKHQLIAKKYFLFTGMISIRKNLLNLIKAYKQSQIYNDYQLVLAGSHSMGFNKIMELVKKENLTDKIIFTDFISDAELADLYSNAKVFLFPTFYEGFGMPILEAMHYELPVLIGNAGSAPEVANGNAIECIPFDIESISNGMKMLLNVSNENIVAAKKHAQGFTWEKCADKTIEVYNRVLTE